MYAIPQRTHKRLGSNPLNFFSIGDLSTIEEASQKTRSMALSDNDEVSSAHDGLTALPRWEKVQSPRSIYSPKRPHTRHGSQDPVLEKQPPYTYTDAELAFPPPPTRSGANSPNSEKNPRHSRMMVWLVLVLVIVLVLAIILGAVLGTFINPGGGSGPKPSVTEIPAGQSPSPTPTPTSTATGENGDPLPTGPPHINSLAVTGWSVPGQAGYFTVWLFSQNTEGYLNRYSFNSSTGNWTRVTNFAAAGPMTPLTAAAFTTEYYSSEPYYDFPDTHYQAEVVYLDKNGYLNEWIFPDGGPVEGLAGPLTEQKYIAHEKTNLAFLWPRLDYQGMSGEIRQVHFECHRKEECWHEKVLDTSEALNGTHLVKIPTQNKLASTGLFYQEKDGRTVNYVEDADNATSAIWANQVYANKIPSTSAIAAFSTTRTKNPKDSKLNTYLLWQDEKGTIRVTWTDNDEGWKGPITHPAFAGADNNTALACLTGLTYPGFPLEAGTELARCYFQTGPAIREVSFDGTSWDIVGNVPIEF